MMADLGPIDLACEMIYTTVISFHKDRKVRRGERCRKGVHVRTVAGRADSCRIQDSHSGGDDSPQGQLARVDSSYSYDVESILCGIRMP